jgi:FdhD protein
MRTPGHDSELVSGFLFGEGVIDDPDEILAIDRPADVPAAQRDDVVSVALAVRRRPRGAERLFYSSSGCGICGKRSLDSIEVRSIPVQSDLTIPLQVLSTLPDSLRAAQALFSRSGGVHAAGLFTPTGERVLVREDVGRHNALDKVLGWALAEGRVPLSQHLVVMSSRLSFELVQKAIAAGIPLIAAVGAPSSLAVELGERFGVTLVGFLRDTGMNVYTHPRRIGR